MRTNTISCTKDFHHRPIMRFAIPWIKQPYCKKSYYPQSHTEMKFVYMYCAVYCQQSRIFAHSFIFYNFKKHIFNILVCLNAHVSYRSEVSGTYRYTIKCILEGEISRKKDGKTVSNWCTAFNVWWY